MKIDNEYLLEIKEKANKQRSRIISELRQTEARCSALRDELQQATGAISMIDMFILRLESSEEVG